MATVTVTDAEELVQLKPKDYKGKVDPDWCPGCGDFGALNSLQKVTSDLQIQPHNMCLISGIGCSSNFPGFFNSYGMHTLHGRILTVATGVKMANHKLTVVGVGGDGDGYGIGGNHWMHTARRNVDLNYFVLNNQIYGLTTGQTSPTSCEGMKTKSTPFGNVEQPLNPITSSIMNGATFVARGYTGDPKHLQLLMTKAIQHSGFSIIDIFSPCVTFNHDQDYAFFRPRVKKLEDESHDTSDWKAACERAMEWGDTIYTGLFYEVDRPTLHSLEPVLEDDIAMSDRDPAVTKEQAERILKRMM